MKSSRHNDQQIIAILKQHESGIPVADLCREHGIGNSTFYKWRAKDRARWDKAARRVNEELGHGKGRKDTTALYIGARS